MRTFILLRKLTFFETGFLGRINLRQNFCGITRSLLAGPVARITIAALALSGPWSRANAADASSPVNTPPFRFTLSTEPSSADPGKISSSEANYFIFNVLRGLYRTNEKGDVEPELAKSCSNLSPTLIECEIRESASWSDGTPVRASDFVYSWRRLVDPNGSGSKGLGLTLLTHVKGALDAHSGKIKPEKLGVTARGERKLSIELSEEDPEMIAKLAHPSLAPIREGFDYDKKGILLAPVTGPYRVVSWSPSRIRLENNSRYDSFQRPQVEILIVDDDETGLNLYRDGTLSFLRRLPTHYLKSYRMIGDKKNPELIQVPVSRFDYIGFGPELQLSKDLRLALAKSLNYVELKKLYDARGIPGCPGLTPDLMDDVPCFGFDLKAAKLHLEKARKSSAPASLPSLVVHFSKFGGDDNQKGMEWIQNQWKKNLGLDVEIKALDQGVFINELKTRPPSIFRKGVGLDRHTCLAAVEIFLEGDPENYIRLQSSEYKTRVQALAAARSDKDKRRACSLAIQYLVDEALLIPLGLIHFSMLAKQNFAGWSLSPLNQLDLRRLQVARPLSKRAAPAR